MTIKELLCACNPDVKVCIQRLGYAPAMVVDAWLLMYDICDQPDEKVRELSVENDVLIIGLNRKNGKKGEPYEY